MIVSFVMLLRIWLPSGQHVDVLYQRKRQAFGRLSRFKCNKKEYSVPDLAAPASIRELESIILAVCHLRDGSSDRETAGQFACLARGEYTEYWSDGVAVSCQFGLATIMIRYSTIMVAVGRLNQ